MRALLPLLLVVFLPHVKTNGTMTGRQRLGLRCHVCEKENSFDCKSPTQCDNNNLHCVTAAVKILPRFYYVSKQCEVQCPIIEIPPNPKNFRLEAPMPFLYLKCCNTNLCNEEEPNLPGLNATFKGSEGSGGMRISSGALVLPFTLTLTSVLLSPTLS
ncbi:lymphocyte antigen 6K [Erinaceus europaeus]|uniref:Lymphocyte antigen 6K n=1 Tax=Erinaceus europaeus TaxID=9365 RepID=A0ABM3XST9_ERIEU|nr:lymphocyte antigen 6K [Erinaceus europaeus]